MCFGTLHSLLAERQSESRPSVPIRPLVHVVGTQKIPALSRDDVESRLIQVRQIRGKSLGGTMMAGDRLHCVSTARLLIHSGARPKLQDRNFSENRMPNVHCIELSPPPGS